MTKPIRIVDRFRPFSHRLGTTLPIPYSSSEIEVYPSLFLLKDIETKQLLAEIHFAVQGPIDQFTAQLDLDKNFIRIWGLSKNGWLRVIVKSLQDGISIHFEKKPEDFAIEIQCALTHNIDDQSIFFAIPNHIITHEKEILSLGSHKKLDWDHVERRRDLRDIFPCWFLLGQTFEKKKEAQSELLDQCKEKIFEKPEHILDAFLQLYLVHFKGIFSPQQKDLFYQAIKKDEKINSPLALLVESAVLIRKLFISQSDNQIAILPHLPPQFFCGRLLNLKCDQGILNIEWTKKKMRRMTFFPHLDAEIHFQFPSHIKKFRLRTSLKEKGKQCFSGVTSFFSAQQVYHFDRFEH